MSIESAAVPRGAQPQKHGTKYGSFRGVDFASEPTNMDAARSPMAINLMAGEGGYPEKRPGYRPIWDMLQMVRGGEGGNSESFARMLVEMYFEDLNLPAEVAEMMVPPLVAALEHMFCVRSIHRCIFSGVEHILAEINGIMYRIFPKSYGGGNAY